MLTARMMTRPLRLVLSRPLRAFTRATSRRPAQDEALQPNWLWAESVDPLVSANPEDPALIERRRVWLDAQAAEDVTLARRVRAATAFDVTR